MKTCASLLVHQRDALNTGNCNSKVLVYTVNCFYTLTERVCISSEEVSNHILTMKETFLAKDWILCKVVICTQKKLNSISLYAKKKKKSDLTVFLNHNNKNKQTKNTIISEYSLDKTTAFKIKTLMHFTRWKMLIVNEHCTLSVSCSRWPSVRLATTQEPAKEVQAYVLCLKWKEKKQKGASFYKHFSENYHSIWDQFTPGAKNRINRQHMKAEKVRFPWELHSWLHLQLNFKIQMNITMVVHICSPSVF